MKKIKSVYSFYEIIFISERKQISITWMYFQLLLSGGISRRSVWFHLHNVPEMTEFRMGLGATGGLGNRCDPQRTMPQGF